jgi:outer membrane protease
MWCEYKEQVAVVDGAVFGHVGVRLGYVIEHNNKIICRETYSRISKAKRNYMQITIEQGHATW